MTVISTSIDENRVSAIVGYAIEPSLDGVKAGNLPQRIGVFAEANALNQVGLPASINFTEAKEVADICGYGSPAYHIARILRPVSGDVLGGIPTVIYPIEQAVAGTAKVLTTTVTGTATATVEHEMIISGRNQVDGASYKYVVEKDDTPTLIAAKMKDAANIVLGCPGIGTSLVADFVLTGKWKGATNNEMNITINTNGNSAGLTYAVVITSAAAGTPTIADALVAIGEKWDTLLVNGIGSDSSILDALEVFNGNPNDKDGRYLPSVFKPLVAYFGDNSITTVAGITAITDARKDENTNKHSPAPNSTGFSFEAAANDVMVYAPVAQSTPHRDIVGLTYPDMPTAEDIGDYASPTKREQMVRVGGATVKVNNNKYEIVDPITTYHPTSEPATSTFFRFVRDIVGVDWNVKYSYALQEEIHVVGKTIIPDTSSSQVVGTISAKRWKGILFGLADDLEARALIADAAFMKTSIQAQQGTTNTNRFETAFSTQRTGIARVNSTSNKILFKFGG